jgi:hypothetical protein
MYPFIVLLSSTRPIPITRPIPENAATEHRQQAGFYNIRADRPGPTRWFTRPTGRFLRINGSPGAPMPEHPTHIPPDIQLIETALDFPDYIYLTTDIYKIIVD